ncbi:RT0821/Lpp0805 family surface protein [Pelagibius sp. Alg239-R121]|uniref:RT0821/Lpp0805 family surface protein n=1 Tax=Pelagibius sp. Alg239-R121 TaxID=2993448 RepID=UPI0024A73861|nr:RT0821/Lpp0805 family surface protein [Pelagibius sp. Alg239-R121]
MRTRTTVMALTLVLLTAACENGDGPGTKQTIGGILGGVGGAVVGAQVGSGSGQLVATAAGALLGALVGSEIGKSLDNADKEKAEQAYTQATTAPIGQEITWDNPDSGNSGTVTATREGTTENGNYCREFQQEVTIGGKEETAYGVACRQPDGSWQIQS